MSRILIAAFLCLAVGFCQIWVEGHVKRQVSAYTVPAGFPTSLFPAYYIPPSPTEEVRLRAETTESLLMVV